MAAWGSDMSVIMVAATKQNHGSHEEMHFCS